MTTTGRAFVAVVPPETVLDAIEAVTAPLRGSIDGARWATREQWHVTLQFLGNHVDFDAVAGALGALAANGGEARLGGGGAFPGERRGRLLWAGLAEGADVLTRLADDVGTLLAPLGREAESRPYHAHLTLARLKTPADLRAAIDTVDATELGPTWLVDDVVVFRSHTRRGGAAFEPFARIPLARPDGRMSPVG